MPRGKLAAVACICLILGWASPARPQSVEPRVTVRVGDVIASPDDSLVRVPVFLSNPKDTVAGVQFNLTIDQNYYLYFALDDITADGSELAVDTVGSLIGGWEWFGINSTESDFMKMKVAAMADWPGGTVTPPLQPQEGGLLLTLVFRMTKDTPMIFSEDVSIPIHLLYDGANIADYKGNSVGVVTTIEKVCAKMVGDSCVAWDTRRVGRLDSTIVDLQSGSILISDSLSHK